MTARLSAVELELATIRLHDSEGDDLGTVELPDGWMLELGDFLAAYDGRLVRVETIIPSPRGSVVAALVRVLPAGQYPES